jgi:Protein of unknown function (DUF2917)
MSSMQVLQHPADPAGLGMPARWTLARDRAISLTARQPGCLRVANGAVWATLDGPHVQGAANEWGDQVLRSGACLQLQSGQHVVLETYAVAANESSSLSWEPMAAEDAPAASRLVRLWRAVRARLSSAVGSLGQWFEPGPG